MCVLDVPNQKIYLLFYYITLPRVQTSENVEPTTPFLKEINSAFKKAIRGFTYWCSQFMTESKKKQTASLQTIKQA
jgi:hypothetical protein